MLENNEASGGASPIISHQGKDADCIWTTPFIHLTKFDKATFIIGINKCTK